MNSLTVDQPDKVFGWLSPVVRSILNNTFYKCQAQTCFGDLHCVYVDVDPDIEGYIRYQAKEHTVWAHRLLIEKMIDMSGCSQRQVHIFFAKHYI